MNTDNTYLSYAHIQHVATDNGYGMTCDDCHAQTVPNDCTTAIAGTTGFDNHVNGVKSISFSTTLRATTINQSTGTWDNANKTCSATYCHSTGIDNDAAGGFTGSLTSPRWDNVNIAGCTYCHGGGANTSNPIMTNAHDNHVNNAAILGVNYNCRRCHYATIQNNDNVTLFSRAVHVNGVRNVSFDNGGSYASATVTCSNTLCHQQGNAALPAGAGADNIAIRWDNNVNAGCRRCHGSVTGGTVAGFTNSSQFGEPNYDNGISGVSSSTQNSHRKHVSVAGDCKDCHRETVSGTAIDNASFVSDHINDNVEVYPGPGVAFTWTAGTHTCASISCHGGNGATWGASLTCFNCHSGTEQGYKPQPSAGTPNPVDNTQYLSRGHGRTQASGAYAATQNPPAHFDNTQPVADCYYCHSQSSAHTTKDANDPYRLGYGADTSGQKAGGPLGAWADNTDGLCLKCHGSAADRSGIAGAATVAVNKQTHSKAIAGAKIGAWTLTPWKCVDCHDPHGDANNAMVRGGINAPTAVGDNTASGAGSNSKGTPNRTTGISAVVFTDNTGYAANSYAAPGVGTYGICEVCHVQTSAYSRTADSTAAHTATGYCIACHDHGVGFKGLGGPDVGQYFDRKIQAPGPSNYYDNSSHPLRGLTDNTAALLFAGSTNCLGCHYASGPARTSDECLKCHFENVSGASGALGTQHMDKTLQLAVVSGNALPGAAYTITTLAQYDAWCLQCHDTGATTSLGGITPSAGNKTVKASAAFANGRHRANTIGCIYCHQPHGRGNAKLVRENGWNRSQAGVVPTMFGVGANDNLNTWYPPLRAQTVNYRARQYWGDNTLPYLGEADDDQAYCNTMCHVGRFSASYVKDKIIRRDATSGNYLPGPSPAYRKIFLVNNVGYSIDNVLASQHQHVNGEIIPTDNMIAYYAALTGSTGPSYYKYPGAAGSLPSSYVPASSPLPLAPDYNGDGARDFTNAYNNLGQRIAYRITCSTCHDPHGNTMANAPGNDGYPDLRLQRANPSTLCVTCHK
jgi:predicted CxxxxCH...CXXCH cytochrome family protein